MTVHRCTHSANLDVVDSAPPRPPRRPIVEIGSPAGSTAIPSSLDGWVELDLDSRLRVSDSVNVWSAALTAVPGGIRLGEVVTTLVGHDRRDPTRAALLDAVAAIMQEETAIAVHSGAGMLTLIASGYTLTCS